MSTNQRHEQRKFLMRLEILQALNVTTGYLLPEPALHNHINLSLPTPALLAEFRGELVELEHMGLLTMVEGSMGGPRKIRLTDAGRAEVAANT